jgi:hypothetical protein
VSVRLNDDYCAVSLDRKILGGEPLAFGFVETRKAEGSDGCDLQFFIFLVRPHGAWSMGQKNPARFMRKQLLLSSRFFCDAF